MTFTTQTTATSELKHFDWRPMDALPRDKEQSRLLHEPRFRIMKTDPISGHDVDDYMSHCSLLDGNLTICFDTEENCKAYKAMPFNHPNLRLPFSASVDDDRGG
jgi:hypothetical protein